MVVAVEWLLCVVAEKSVREGEIQSEGESVGKRREERKVGGGR